MKPTPIRRSRQWVRTTGRNVFISADCGVGIAGGVVAGIAATDKSVRANAVTILLPEAGIAVALFTVVIAAMAILATFFDDAYRRVLETASGSVGKALRPYRVVAVIAGAATLAALLAALVWPAVSTLLEAIFLGLATGLTAWTIAGCVQLTSLTIWHADQRSKLMRGIEDAKLHVSQLQKRRA